MNNQSDTIIEEEVNEHYKTHSLPHSQLKHKLIKKHLYKAYFMAKTTSRNTNFHHAHEKF
jgi:hypothetical protein